MNLKEYLSQKIPVKQTNVLLTKKDLIFKSGAAKRVYINSSDERVAGIEYLLIGTRLYTVDSDGNVKNMSCFKITL